MTAAPSGIYTTSGALFHYHVRLQPGSSRTACLQFVMTVCHGNNKGAHLYYLWKCIGVRIQRFKTMQLVIVLSSERERKRELITRM